MAAPTRVARTNRTGWSAIVVWAVKTCFRRLWRAPGGNSVLWATVGGNRRLFRPCLLPIHAIQDDASGIHPVRSSRSISPSRTAWRAFLPVARHCHELMLYQFIPPRKRRRQHSAAKYKISSKSAKLVTFNGGQNALSGALRCIIICKPSHVRRTPSTAPESTVERRGNPPLLPAGFRYFAAGRHA